MRQFLSILRELWLPSMACFVFKYVANICYSCFYNALNLYPPLTSIQVLCVPFLCWTPYLWWGVKLQYVWKQFFCKYKFKILKLHCRITNYICNYVKSRPFYVLVWECEDIFVCVVINMFFNNNSYIWISIARLNTVSFPSK